jgi:replicative DNA helicase
MMDLTLLRFMSLNKDTYDRFRKYVKSHTITKETELLLSDFEEYWTCFPGSDAIDWAQFKMWFKLVKHPSFDTERQAMFETIFTRVQAEPPPDKTVIDKFIELDYTAQVRDTCDRVIRGDGKTKLDSVTTLIERYVDEVGHAGKDDADYFVTSNLSSILDDLIRSHGLEWRLEDLNVSVGPIHGGDFIVIGARPETGKTTLLCSEFTHMTPQLPLDKEAIIFNNEEDGRKIFLRLVQAALGYTILDISADEVDAEARYKAMMGNLNRIRVVHKDSTLSVFDVERYLKQGNYGLVGINVLDKLRGFDKDENEVSRQRRLAQQIRHLAVKYNTPIMACMQADAGGEGKAWLDASQLYGSKTGIQGEADVILMVGSTYELDTRYVSVVKNKLPGGPRTKAVERHGKFEVRFDPEKARYASKFY